MGDAGRGANRGVALLGDKVFFVTDHAHMVALDRLTGRLLWDTEMADYKDHYGGTTRAARHQEDVVIGGVGGGDEGIRGFPGCLRRQHRRRALALLGPSRCPASRCRRHGKAPWLPHGCGGTWLTGDVR